MVPNFYTIANSRVTRCVSCILHADKKKLSKSELDRLIDERVLLYTHPDDAQGAIEALKKEGVTDYEEGEGDCPSGVRSEGK